MSVNEDPLTSPYCVEFVPSEFSMSFSSMGKTWFIPIVSKKHCCHNNATDEYQEIIEFSKFCRKNNNRKISSINTMTK